jgi:diguanylate cyclase (GGDEF)-like protein
MTRLPPSRLLARIILSVSATFFLLMVAGSLWTVHTHSKLAYEEQERSVGMIAKGLADAVAREMVTRDYRSLEQRLRQTLSLPDVHSALVADLDGRVLSSAQRSGSNGAITISYTPLLLEPPATPNRVTTNADNFSVGWYRIDVGVPVGWVRVETTNEHFKGVISRVQRDTTFLAIFGTLIVASLLIEALHHTSQNIRARESEVEMTENRLSNMAYFDSLTDLPNRTLLDDRLRQAIARTKREHTLLAVCFVDLDAFKPVNDRYGHKTGDQLLQQVSQRLLDCIREGDTAARYGGDEFVLLLEGLDHPRECKEIVDRLLASLTQPYPIGGRVHSISASIGATLYPADDSHAEQLIRHADQSMYEAKQSGGNRLCFYTPQASS